MTEPLGTTNSAVANSKFGPIQIYRELKPTKNEVEFTIYFRKDGKKWRIDLVEDADDMQNLHAEEYMWDRFYAAVEAGNYRDATIAIDDASQNGK
jgi:hypothetical protein